MNTTNAGKELKPDYFEMVVRHTDLTEDTVDTAMTFTMLEQQAGKNILVKDAHIEVLEPFDSADAANVSLLADLGDDDPDLLIDGVQLHAATDSLFPGTAASLNSKITHANGVVLTLTPGTAGKALSGFNSGKAIVRIAAFIL